MKDGIPLPPRVSQILGLPLPHDLWVVEGAEIVTTRQLVTGLLESGVTLDDLEEARYQFLSAWTELDAGDATKRCPVMRQAVGVFLAAGLTITMTARYIIDGLPNNRHDPLFLAALDAVVKGIDIGRTVNVDVFAVLAAETQLRAGNNTFAQVARECGLDEKIVRRLARHIGVKAARAWTPADIKNRAIELHNQGLGPSQILCALRREMPEASGVTVESVRQWLSRHRRSQRQMDVCHRCDRRPTVDAGILCPKCRVDEDTAPAEGEVSA